MKKENRTEDQDDVENRDKVLFAFNEAHTRPTAEQIVKWIDLYPQFAEDIRAHAAVAREWDTEMNCAAEPDESFVASAYSRALNLIHKSDNEKKASGESFQEIIAARHSSVPQVARDIDIDRSIVADLVSGRMKEPIKNVFVEAINRVLHISRDKFFSALQYSLTNPRLGHAKADSVPLSIARPYEEIIRSNKILTDAQKRRWLEEN